MPQTQSTVAGAYQLEIRDASEYVRSALSEIVDFGVEILRFAAAPIVIPIGGVPYGIDSQFPVPDSEILPESQKPPFQIFNLPTVDIQVDAATGQPITQFVNQNTIVTIGGINFTIPAGSIVVFLEDGTTIPLIELDSTFLPLLTQSNVEITEARFRTFDTNDRLVQGFAFETFGRQAWSTEPRFRFSIRGRCWTSNSMLVLRSRRITPQEASTVRVIRMLRTR